MLVNIDHDGTSVQVEDPAITYSPDVLDDFCTRARDLFRLVRSDLAHSEHEPE